MDDLDRRMQRVLVAAREEMRSAGEMGAQRTRRAVLAATAGVAVGAAAGTAAASTAAATTGATSVPPAAAAAATAGSATGIASATKGAGLFAAISSLSLGTKVVTAVAVSISVGTAGIWATRAAAPAVAPMAPAAPIVVSHLNKPAVVPTLAAPVANAVAEPIAPVEPTPMPHAASAVSHATAPAAEKPEAPDPLVDELALIERARQALRGSNPNEALSALAEHQRRFSHGVMTQERTALRALALCSLGDPQGKVEAERFLEANPNSPLSMHLRSGCK